MNANDDGNDVSRRESTPKQMMDFVRDFQCRDTTDIDIKIRKAQKLCKKLPKVWN